MSQLQPTHPLLELNGVYREFPAGDETIAVLKHIDLQIHAGEFVAIVGASGSGKSTLMNILGCLDRPSQGVYRVAGRETGKLEPNELARLRREHFGFIFQRYHLLSDLNAAGNVEMPAVYAGAPGQARHERAQELLTRLGLLERIHYKPGQLSGGQQQRVSIARALMNGGDVILADEPTGALDTHSGQEVMRILKELNAEGHTIIIVTHDMAVAQHARRIIEISDGLIIKDTKKTQEDTRPSSAAVLPSNARKTSNPVSALIGRTNEALHMALLAMAAHKLRTFLTMLGIIIGIASVVSVVALGAGSQQQILERISAMGTNTLEIRAGAGWGDTRVEREQPMMPEYAASLAQEDYVDSVSPTVNSSADLRYRNVVARATIQGVSEEFFRVRGYQILEGQIFTEEDVRRQAQDVVIDVGTRDELFGPDANPIGQIILLGALPARVIGVAQSVQNAFSGAESLNVWVPYTTVMYRILRQPRLRSVVLRVDDGTTPAQAETKVTELLTKLRGRQNFFIINSDEIRQTVESTTATMTMLISAIALISLIVGGIGVMNIMLVSVTERTREIGVRMAVGARQSDIMTQFLIEAVLVCLIGGALGIALALSVGEIVPRLGGEGVRMIYSTNSMIYAFICSTAIGIVFGFLPARNAAKLDPVDALARD